MAFKKIPPKVRLCAGAPSASLVVEKLDCDGVQMVSVTHKKLQDIYPKQISADNFSLDAQIKAGVKLKEVSSELLADNIHDVDLSQFEQKEPDNPEPPKDE